MKKLIFFIISIILFNINCYSQNFIREGNTYKSISTNKNNSSVKDTIVTKYFYEDNKNNKYPIIINKSTGSCYIWKISSKTNLPYKMYMKKEISLEISNEYNIKYKQK